MTLEKYWEEHKEGFLKQVEADCSSKDLISRYKTLMEEMKIFVISRHPHEDVFNQMIAVLFSAAAEGAELLPVRGDPVVVYAPEEAQEPEGWMKRVAVHPMVRLVLLGLGTVVSFFAGLRGLPCAAVFLGTAALQTLALRTKEKPAALPTAETPMSGEYLDSFITRQAKHLDQQIEDIRKLCEDMTRASDEPLDDALAALCQHVWAVEYAGYPAESAVYMAEKILRDTGNEWVEYGPEMRNAFEVMTTRQASRTIFPAIRRIDDGTVTCRGQYVETKGVRTGA